MIRTRPKTGGSWLCRCLYCLLTCLTANNCLSLPVALSSHSSSNSFFVASVSLNRTCQVAETTPSTGRSFVNCSRSAFVQRQDLNGRLCSTERMLAARLCCRNPNCRTPAMCSVRLYLWIHPLHVQLELVARDPLGMARGVECRAVDGRVGLLALAQTVTICCLDGQGYSWVRVLRW